MTIFCRTRSHLHLLRLSYSLRELNMACVIVVSTYGLAIVFSEAINTKMTRVLELKTGSKVHASLQA